MTRVLSIDYSEETLEYFGVVFDGERFFTGDPVLDWRNARAVAATSEEPVIESSSVTHFVFDCDDFRFNESDELERVT